MNTIHISEAVRHQKIRLRHNRLLTDAEYQLACALCDIVSEVVRVGHKEVAGGIFWENVNNTHPGTLYFRKNRQEIEHSVLLSNRFRDFPTVIYEYDHLTPAPDFFVGRYIRLCQGVAKRWHVQIPARFGEIGWNVEGFPVNRHITVLQERVNTQLYFGMERALESSPSPSALEIGGGGGEMAYVICRNSPSVTWYNCDLIQSLTYSAIHMAVWLPQRRHYIYVGNLPIRNVDERYVLRSAAEAVRLTGSVIHVPHFLLEDFTGKMAVDLALNAWSFSEMPESEARRYGLFIKEALTPDGMLIEQNGLHAGRGGCNAKEILESIFPARRSFDSALPLLARAGLFAGPIDRWSLRKLPVAKTIDSSCYDDGKSAPDLKWSPDDFGLIDNFLKPGIV